MSFFVHCNVICHDSFVDFDISTIHTDNIQMFDIQVCYILNWLN